MQRLQVVAPGEAEMMIAPLARHGKIELVPAGALERPAIVLDRLLQHVDGMRDEGVFFLVNNGHGGSRPKHKTKQLRSKLAQDFAAAQESATPHPRSRKRFHSFDRTGISPGFIPSCSCTDS